MYEGKHFSTRGGIDSVTLLIVNEKLFPLARFMTVEGILGGSIGKVTYVFEKYPRVLIAPPPGLLSRASRIGWYIASSLNAIVNSYVVGEDVILLSLKVGSSGSVHAAATLTKLPNSLDSVGPISLQAISASRTANSKNRSDSRCYRWYQSI